MTTPSQRQLHWDDLIGDAQVGLVKAVQSLERRFRANSSTKEPPQSFRSYLGVCIANHLRAAHRRRKAAAAVDQWDVYQWLKDAIASGYATAAQLDKHVSQLHEDERRVFVDRRDGKLWDEIGATIGKSRRQAQRILVDAKHVLLGGIMADNILETQRRRAQSSAPLAAVSGPALPTRKPGVGLRDWRRQNAA
jgi:DNA-directed RNA polymerase specialized sigma24 family protein